MARSLPLLPVRYVWGCHEVEYFLFMFFETFLHSGCFFPGDWLVGELV
jgi:hypothetical protein